MFMRQLTSQIAYAKTSENKLPIELFVLLEDLSASFDHKVGNGWFFFGRDYLNTDREVSD